MEERQITETESLLIIQQMIDRARNSIIEKGTWAIYWGTLITVCSLVLYIEIRMNKFLPFDIFFVAIPALLIQIGIIVNNRRKNNGKPRAVSLCQKAIAYIWTTFAICMFLTPFSKSNSTCIYWILYGIPTFTTGLLIGFTPFIVGGIICWLCVLVNYVFKVDVASQVLLTAVCAFFAWLIPGIIMRRRYARIRKSENV